MELQEVIKTVNGLREGSSAVDVVVPAYTSDVTAPGVRAGNFDPRASLEQVFSLVDGDYVEPSVYTLGAVGAAAAVVRGLGDSVRNVYLLGEHTFGESKPPTAAFMREALLRQTNSLPETAVKIPRARNLNNTPLQVAAFAELQKDERQAPADELLVVAYGFHLPRIKRLMHAHAVAQEPTGLPAETILRTEGYEAYTAAVQALGGFNKKEYVARLITRFYDPTGRRFFVPRTERVGAQVDNVIDGQLVRTTAKDRVLGLARQDGTQ